MNKLDFVILAAGRGERLWPITNHIPKTMVRILKKPLLEWIVERIYEKANKIVLVVGFKKEAVIEHFSQSPYADKIVFVEQKEQKGTAHALLQAEPLVENNFAVINGDNFLEPRVFDEILAYADNEWFLVGKKVEDKSAYGEIIRENGFLKKIIEKPAVQEPGLANTNFALLPKSFFALLRQVETSPRGEFEFIDALNAFAASSNKVKIIEFEGYWNDVGFYWNYLDVSEFACNNLLEDKREGTIEPGVVVNGKLHLGKGSVVRSPCRIEGPVYIGENNLIGPNSFLRAGTIIEDNCHVGSSEIKNSIIMSKSNAPHFNYVGDSVICEDVNLGAGTITANLRFDNKIVFSKVKGKQVSSGKRKLGCVIGSGTKVGINVSITCGMIVGSDCKIYPRIFVKENVDDGTALQEVIINK